MPNADRNLFFEHHGLPTHKRWQDGYAELSLKVYRAFDRVSQLARQTAAALQRDVVHAYRVASLEGTRVFIDFRVAQKFTLILDASVDEIVFIPPTLAANRACSTQLDLVQAGAGTSLVTAWTDAVREAQLVFFAPDSVYMSGGLPILSTAVGRVDVLTISYDSFMSTMRGMYTRGATA